MTTRARVPADRSFTPELIENARRRYEETDEPIVTIAADLGIHRHSLRRLARNYNWIRRIEPAPRDLSPAMRLLEEAQAMAAGAPPQPAERPPEPRAAFEPGASSDAPLRPHTPFVPAQAGTQSFNAVQGRNESGPPLAPGRRGEIESIGTNSGAAAGGETAPAELSTIERLERAVLAELATVEAMRASLGPLPQRWTDAERTARTLGLLTQTLQHLQRLRAGSTGSRADDYDMPEDIDAFRFELARRIDAFVASRTGANGVDGADGE